eukprot:TRINITY_DN3270_c0_g1_i1.p1 TRINITY_DN3270_c0_g1~~TRINITY_DN3270_c0_g1_i1.p1  ORF type:complete len:176 (+),score=37.21 TRINITY_DN3270_c0_g1_i1:41-568(+)
MGSYVQYLKGILKPNIRIPVKVTDYMYLGDYLDVSNKKTLDNLKITHILNVADDVQNYFPKDYIYKNLMVRDLGQDEGITRVFDEAFDFINKVKQEETRVFVHCIAGINRSPTICIASLMKLENKTLKESYDMIVDKRQIQPFNDNIEALINFEKKLYQKNTMEVKDFKKIYSDM